MCCCWLQANTREWSTETDLRGNELKNEKKDNMTIIYSNHQHEFNSK